MAEVTVFKASLVIPPLVASMPAQPEKLGASSRIQRPIEAPLMANLDSLVASKLPRVSFKLNFPKLPQVLSQKGVQLALSGLVAVSILILLVVVTPELYYQVFPAESVPVETDESGTPLGGAFDQDAEPEPTATPRPLPPQDMSLPEGTWLVIPRIGVRTEPMAADDSEEALLKGVWQVPGYGTPGDTSMPLILAAHRYGWQWWWKTDYWKYHSFYALPELQPGDMVEVIHDQRKFYYEVYAGEEGDEITDYSADMILYTCKFLNSPIRHFRYARLIDMAKDSQVTQVSQL